MSASPKMEQQIDGMASKLTLEQKIDLIGGVSTWYTRAEPSIGLRALRLSDGPAGLRSGIPATAYPAPIALAASWDTALAKQMGAALGRDARARNVDVLLGPGVNIARAPMTGRNFEYMGEDPYLTSRIAVAYIQGVQSQNVSATIKHFMMNNQEFNRNNASSDADERTMREIYLPAFEAAVKEGHVGAIMDSYNLVNGAHSTQNTWMNTQLAKQEWKFDGIIMSDWNSVYDGVAAANGGLDLEMPFGRYFSRETLLPAVKAGTIPLATIDDKVRRILRTALRFTPPEHTSPESLFSEASDRVALDVGRESIVLLKNEESLLPLSVAHTCTIAVIGPNASPAVIGGGGSAVVDSYKSVSALVGISDYVEAHATANTHCHPHVVYDAGWPANYDVFAATHFDHGLLQQIFPTRDWTGIPTPSNRDQLNEDRITPPAGSSIRWTGTFTANKPGHYYVIVHDGRVADKHQVFIDGKELPSPRARLNGELYYLPLPEPLASGQHIDVRMDYLPNDTEVFPGLGILFEDDVLSDRARTLAREADAVIVTVGFDKSTEHEGADRTFELPLLQDAMIRNLAEQNHHLIVTLTGGGNVDMRPWIDHVPALLHLWYPGQEGGTSLAEVLFGTHNPEGKLPVGFEMRWEDNPTFRSYYPQDGATKAEPRIRYTEGVFLGYRYYETPSVNTAHTSPRFPFGFGLSYTSFAFSNLHLSATELHDGDPLTATFTITNTGSVDGAEVAQLYVGEQSPQVPRPLYELKAFTKVLLRPGERREVSLSLDRRSFAYWSESEKQWKVDPARFTVYVGDSSDNLPLRSDIIMHDAKSRP
jgi:beta-glucosidase